MGLHSVTSNPAYRGRLLQYRGENELGEVTGHLPYEDTLYMFRKIYWRSTEERQKQLIKYIQHYTAFMEDVLSQP